MREISNSSDYMNVFNNISEFLNYIENKPHKSGRDNASQTSGDKGWYGTNSYEEAVERLKYGDDDLFEKLNAEIKKLNINNMLGNARRKNVYYNDVNGFIPNVPNMMVGSPLTMINIKKDGLSQRVVNIFLNIRVGNFVDGDDVIKIGLKYLNVIDLLEKRGYRCNLYSGVANSKGNGKHCCLMVRVKTDREPLNLKKICFAIANPAMQRRLKFKWMEVNDGPDFTCGYGQAEEESYIKKLLSKELKDNFVVWNYESENKSKTVEQLVDDLKKMGIDIEL